MIEQLSNPIRFHCAYTSLKVGKTGLTVTVDVYRGSTGAQIVTAASATETGGGLYRYQLSGTNTGTASEYLAVFHTTDSTVDSKDIFVVWVVGTGWVQFLDAAISAIKTVTDQIRFTIANKVDSSIQAAGDFAQAAADKVWSTASRTLTAFSATFLAPVWDVLTSAISTVGSIGKLLTTDIDAAISSRAASGITVTISSPVASDGTLSVVHGDDYFAVDSRSIDFTFTSAPSLTGAAAKLSFRRSDRTANDLEVTGSVLSVTQLRFEPTAAQTLRLTPGATYAYDVQAILTGTSHVTTLQRGTATILQDYSPP